MPEPLLGITVLEMTVALQGPSAGLYLRDQGAEVIKIEPPPGDAQRYHRGRHNSSPPDALAPGFIAVNRGKKSVCLDVHQSTGREVVAPLLDRADVFLTDYREPFLRSIGLDYETLAPTHPQLVWARVNGFGPQGPDANKPMLDGAFLPNVEGAYGAYTTRDGGAFMLALAQDEEAWDALWDAGLTPGIAGSPSTLEFGGLRCP